MIKVFCVVLLAFSSLIAKEVGFLTKEKIIYPPYKNNAILRQDALFVDDFWVLHSLIKMAKPVTLFEIGTCTGEGTLIIKNAIGKGVVYSLDLPPGLSSYDLGNRAGERCYLPYVQIFGDSMTLSYQDYYPIESWFIDGAHDYEHVYYETLKALESNPKIIIYHDADIPEVFQGIKDGLEDRIDFLLYRVVDTRIAFAVPSNSSVIKAIR